MPTTMDQLLRKVYADDDFSPGVSVSPDYGNVIKQLEMFQLRRGIINLTVASSYCHRINLEQLGFRIIV